MLGLIFQRHGLEVDESALAAQAAFVAKGSIGIPQGEQIIGGARCGGIATHRLRGVRFIRLVFNFAGVRVDEPRDARPARHGFDLFHDPGARHVVVLVADQRANDGLPARNQHKADPLRPNILAEG